MNTDTIVTLLGPVACVAYLLMLVARHELRERGYVR